MYNQHGCVIYLKVNTGLFKVQELYCITIILIIHISVNA